MSLNQVTYSEWLPSGVMVHFADQRSVLFPWQLLVDHRDEQPALLDLVEDEDGWSSGKCGFAQKSGGLFAMLLRAKL